MSFMYLGALLFSLSGLVFADWRHRLALFIYPKKTVMVIIISVVFFLIWDAVGIMRGIFFTGPAEITTEIMLAPELPLEEPVFLILLCYSALILWQIGGRIWNIRS